ncbi:MAG TPA: helix-hairpin-helix domain-containing protein [Polyangiales bacterium]|nr:helix-hairpin-helix domain-containing protein [Polyangiales bacterium]
MANPEQKLVHAPAEENPSQSPHDARLSSGALDLNSANEAEIAEIDMIGKKIAHAIVAQRSANGPFSNWEDLKGIEGLDAKRLAELQRAARIQPS